jgi:hypothetical protein
MRACSRCVTRSGEARWLQTCKGPFAVGGAAYRQLASTRSTRCGGDVCLYRYKRNGSLSGQARKRRRWRCPAAAPGGRHPLWLPLGAFSLSQRSWRQRLPSAIATSANTLSASSRTRPWRGHCAPRPWASESAASLARPSKAPVQPSHVTLPGWAPACTPPCPRHGCRRAAHRQQVQVRALKCTFVLQLSPAPRADWVARLEAAPLATST